jgi:ATP-dependent Clp protease ATP-binding subunit ClpC
MVDDQQRYTNVLQEGRDTVEAASRNQHAREILYREAEIQAVVEAWERNRSVLITGHSGVGKSAVLVAAARHIGQSGMQVREFTVTQILAGTRYIGDWQTKLSSLMVQAAAQRSILNILDVLNLAEAGATIQNAATFLDAMRPNITSGEVRIVGELETTQLHALNRVSGFAALFDIIRIEPLTGEQLRHIVEREAARLGLDLDPVSSERLLQLCTTFQPGILGPGPGLELIAKTKDYQDQKRGAGEDATLTPTLIEKVFAIHSGLPRFVVSSTERKSASEIREWFRERIIGQEAAIDAVVEMTALFKSRLHDKNKPIGSFFFVGPTGVGKTELARAIAVFFFGSERRMLRFDMSEFADYSAFEMLLGTPREPGRPARLVDPVRVQPFQVILFDEIEKGHRNIQDMLLQLLDEGHISTPKGELVSFRNAIVIVTSNAGSTEGMTPAIGFGRGAEGEYDADKAMQAIESQFRPEFLNRFHHVVLFHPLTLEQAARIANIEVKSVLKREGIADRNLIVDVDRSAIEHVLNLGFTSRHGARAIKREVKRQIMLPIATLLMEREVEAGSLLHVRYRDGRIRVDVVETDESRRAKAENQPIRTRDGERLTRKAIMSRFVAAETQCSNLVQDAVLSRLRAEIEEIDERGRNYQVWHDSNQAARALTRQSQLLESASRLDRLQEGIANLKGLFSRQLTRSQLDNLTGELLRLEDNLAVARRELVAMGREGYCDAIVEIAPVGDSGEARDFLFSLYAGWAKERGSQVVMVSEPMANGEPVMFAVRRHYAFGYLEGESGHHRVRIGKKASVARITVAPWTDRTAPVPISQQRALKGHGQLGGRIRSRIEIGNSGLIIQNERTLNDNLELAGEIAANWPPAGVRTVSVVRRYDLSPFRCRDYQTGLDFTRSDILNPRQFNALLSSRVALKAEVTAK